MQSRRVPAEAGMTSISNQIIIQAPAFSGIVREPQVYVTDETASDLAAREALLDRAFGSARFEKTVERLREGRRPASRLALAAKDGDALVGTLRLWHVRAGTVPALLLGPLAVETPYRSLGIGRRLMAEALFRAHGLGHAAILLVGDAPYYEPFGFARRHTLRLALPGPVDERRFLGLDLVAGALSEAKGLVVATGVPAFAGALATDDLRHAA
jgi:predicted N-acetyltransferase YhbS